mmetsp:Transcript_38149/g.50262  ORF Transcript_38149/g.50262 Transcript_38149/m.50262 type:complete len:212 (+) Transcript_38149:53-688(+)
MWLSCHHNALSASETEIIVCLTTFGYQHQNPQPARRSEFVQEQEMIELSRENHQTFVKLYYYRAISKGWDIFLDTETETLNDKSEGESDEVMCDLLSYISPTLLAIIQHGAQTPYQVWKNILSFSQNCLNEGGCSDKFKDETLLSNFENEDQNSQTAVPYPSQLPQNFQNFLVSVKKTSSEQQIAHENVFVSSIFSSDILVLIINFSVSFQ